MFAWLVIFSGMGMGASFMFMWITSILEMWLFKPIFIDGFGSCYLQQRDSAKTSVADRAWFYCKVMGQLVKRAASFATEQWQTKGLPVIKEWLKK